MRSSLALGLFALWLPAHGANIAAPRVQSGPIATVPFAAAVPSLQAHAGLSAPLGGVTGLLAPALAAPSLQLSPIAAAAAAPAEAVSFELDARSPETLRLMSAALEGPGFEGRLDRLFDGGDLRKADPDATPGFPKHSKKEGQKLLKKEQEKLRELQDKLYAGKKHSVLIVLQAMDTAGKDGTIKHVLTGLNPQGVQVTSFKKPTPEEAAHDFLWRIHPNVPAKGMIGVFNRSHYEDILVPSVYKLMPKDKIDARYDEIRNFEKYLADQGVTIVKIYLNISRTSRRSAWRPGCRTRASIGSSTPTIWKPASIGRASEDLRQDPGAHQHAQGAVVRHPRQQEMVSQLRHRAHPARDAGRLDLASPTRRRASRNTGRLSLGGRSARTRATSASRTLLPTVLRQPALHVRLALEQVGGLGVEVEPVKMTIGIFAVPGFSIKAWETSRPFIRGMIMSSRTRSGSSFCASARPASPFSAWKDPTDRAEDLLRWAMKSWLSSTIRMREADRHRHSLAEWTLFE